MSSLIFKIIPMTIVKGTTMILIIL